jgi:uncharacterized protein
MIDEPPPPRPPAAVPAWTAPIGPRPLDRRILTVWRLTAVIRLAPPLLVLAALGAARLPGPWWAGPALASVAFGLGVGPLQAMRWRRFHWELTADTIELTQGLFVRRHVTVPYFRVQQIDVIEGPLDRLVGLATLTLTTASAGGRLALPGIAARDAPDVRRELVARSSAATAMHGVEGRDAV